MNDFIDILLKICGGIGIIYTAGNALAKIFSPYKKLEETVKKHDGYLDNDDKRLKYIEKSNKLNLKCMLALIDHEITGNGINNMSDLKKEVQEFLVEK